MEVLFLVGYSKCTAQTNGNLDASVILVQKPDYLREINDHERDDSFVAVIAYDTRVNVRTDESSCLLQYFYLVNSQIFACEWRCH